MSEDELRKAADALARKIVTAPFFWLGRDAEAPLNQPRKPVKPRGD